MLSLPCIQDPEVAMFSADSILGDRLSKSIHSQDINIGKIIAEYLCIGASLHIWCTIEIC